MTRLTRITERSLTYPNHRQLPRIGTGTQPVPIRRGRRDGEYGGPPPRRQHWGASEPLAKGTGTKAGGISRAIPFAPGSSALHRLHGIA